MEPKSSTISERYRKLCTFGSLIAFLIFILFINQNRHHMENISAFTSTLVFSNSVLSCPDQDDQSNHSPPSISSSSSSSASSNPSTKASSNSSTTLAPIDRAVLHVTSSNSIKRSPDSLRTAPSAAVVTEIEKPTSDDDGTGEKKYCDIFDGRWVYKEEGDAPRYDQYNCPFIEENTSCRRNGRPDLDYEKWTWEPTGCSDIPVFNGTDMLERLRGKRVIIVGDSLNKNQWESLACLLYTSIPSSRAFVDASHPAYKVFRAEDYNCVVEFHWSPFLVELDKKHKSGSRVLVLDKLSSSSDQWKGADVMIFNSAHWWMHHGNLRQWDQLEYKNKLVKDLKIELAYERALTTWVNWIKRNVDPNKTTVFFRSISSEHNGNNWCYNSTMPIADHSTYRQRYPQSMIDVLVKKIKDTGSKSSSPAIRYLNITKMSDYRIDAHPSVYSSFERIQKTTGYGAGRSKSDVRADCSHWCLPGLPDTWNRLVYVSLFFDTSSSKHLSSR